MPKATYSSTPAWAVVDDESTTPDAVLTTLAHVFTTAVQRRIEDEASENGSVTFCDTADVQMRAAAQIPAQSLAGMAVKARMLRTEWESASSLSDFPVAETLLDSLLTDLGAPPAQAPAARPVRNDLPDFREPRVRALGCNWGNRNTRGRFGSMALDVLTEPQLAEMRHLVGVR